MTDYFGYGLWLYDYKEFPTIQLVWSDRNGKFPWESEFEEQFIGIQPLLNKAK